MDTNINVLDELNKGCCMGVDAIDIIIKKVDEFKFKELLENQKNGYEELCNKIMNTFNAIKDILHGKSIAIPDNILS